MSEWWTYSLSDFLLFSPRTYYRLLELYNLAIWPAHILALALGAAILALLRPGPAWQGRVVTAILAACWLWVAWAYFLERYDTINWVASYVAVGFVIEALLLLWGTVVHGLSFRPGSDLASRAGLSLFLFALVVQPLIGPLLGRPWTQVEVFGIAPDPTVVGTLGILLTADGRLRWELLALPALWCAISAATLWTMGSADALVPVLATCLALFLAVSKSMRGVRAVSRQTSGTRSGVAIR
jgi:hypothetical protein